jgi:hypothetical protein
VSEQLDPGDIAGRQAEMRAAAKWLVGAAAGTGAFLLSGVGIVDLVPLGKSSWHLMLATTAFIIALVAIGFILQAASAVLTSPHLTLADLAERETFALTKVAKSSSRLPTSAASFDPILGAIEQHKRLLFRSSLSNVLELYEQVSSAPTRELEIEASRICAFATYKLMETRYRALIRRLALCSAAVASTVVVFLWISRPIPAADSVVDEPLRVEIFLNDVEVSRERVGLGPRCLATVLDGVAIGGTLDEPYVVTRRTDDCGSARFTVTDSVGIAVPRI